MGLGLKDRHGTSNKQTHGGFALVRGSWTPWQHTSQYEDRAVGGGTTLEHTGHCRCRVDKVCRGYMGRIDGVPKVYFTLLLNPWVPLG